MKFEEVHKIYRKTLFDDLIPFWLQHGIDPNGGINTCMTDDGTLQSRDRWGWSQWRAVWVFSKLYTRFEKRPEWLETAQGIAGFMLDHGPLPDGHWATLQDGEGNLLKGFDSIYVDGFAIYALVELWRATRDKHYLDVALRTFEAAEKSMHEFWPPPAYPYPIPEGTMPHGVSMIFSIAYDELAKESDREEARQAATKHHRLVMETFLRKDRGVVLEWLSTDGTELEPPQGTVIVPGHAIESMWFQMHIARKNDDVETLDRACAAIKRHLELGWDNEYGGLLLAVDAEGRNEVAWGFSDAKVWWPHTEALYACLLAYEHTRDDEFLAWHERVHEYSYNLFPDRKHGEWRQRFDRQGRPITDVVALPVKDPFHLPRALIYCVDVLERLEQKQT
ncbi:MAG: AGE family epimerase/isomerase [Candidatus Hydrogenedentes bacterium]|nr:AGE family epimerase/isomerase [Candidatus Hydrogenedentota bacterium]